MPWSIKKRGNQYCVVKDADNSVEGCHDSRDDAIDQMRALYASEDDAGLLESLVEEIPAEHLADMEEIAAQLHALADQLVGEHASEHDMPEVVPEEDYSTEQEVILTDIETPEPITYAWEGPITYEGIETGDRRLFQENAVVWDSSLLPMPFRWQRLSAEGHDSSVTIGRLDSLERRDGGVIWGRGVILDSVPESHEYMSLLGQGAAGGVSIDGDSANFEIEYADEDDPFSGKMVFSSINVRGLTAVDIPAFAGARIELCESIVAAVIGSTDLPIADRSRNWDGLAAQNSIWNWAKTEDGFDASKLARAFLWRDSDGDLQQKGSYKLPFTEVIDGSLTIIPKAVFAAAASIEGARGGVNIPDSDKAGIRRKLGSLYAKIPPVEGEEGHPTPPWESDKGDASSEVEEFSRQMNVREWEIALNGLEDQALTASGIPIDPPAEWFQNPEFDQLTPITITDNGYVFGHLCGKETCHIGYGSCKTSPRNCDYDSYFHLGSIKTSEGELINVGHMTFGGGHAPMEQGAQAAAAYYDSTSRVSADIRCGEDEFGTWVAGALRPSLSAEDVREIRSAPLSGDWRPIKSKLQLIAAHGVNVPGFPIPRVKALVASGGETETLIITEDCNCEIDMGEITSEFDQILFQIDIEETE